MSHLHLVPQRYGDIWDIDDYEALCAQLLTPADDADIAATLGREIPEITAASRFLLPPDTIDRLPASARLPYLRGVLLDPDYPWLENLQHNHRGMVPPWPKGGDRTLTQLWDQGDRLDFTAETLGVPEMQAALRCVRLGLAQNLAEVVETMGPGSEPSVQARANTMVERDEAALDVYVDVHPENGALSVLTLAPGASIPQSCQRRTDGSAHDWLVAPSVAPGEVSTA